MFLFKTERTLNPEFSHKPGVPTPCFFKDQTVREGARYFPTKWDELCQKNLPAFSRTTTYSSKKGFFMEKEFKNRLQKIAFWPEIKALIQNLCQKGFPTVLAGGAVRDILLGRAVKDIDLASPAQPEELLKIFPSAKGKFAKYGVVLVPIKKGKLVEITSFRKDSHSSDGRRPDSISYGTMEEDAQRRDFTINALFYDPQQNSIIDKTGGLKDLREKRLKAVGSPEKRFEEDHLRAIRALRLAHKLIFHIDKATKKAIPLFAQKIKKLSQERILSELESLFSEGRIGPALSLLKQYGFFESLFPGLPQKSPFFKDPFVFWDKNFSFFHEKAFCWAILALPFFYSQPESAHIFLKKLRLKSSDIKKVLSYLKAVKMLTSHSLLSEKLKALEGQKGPVFELSFFWQKSQNLCLEGLNQTLRRYERIQKGGRLPSPLVKGFDILERLPQLPRHKISPLLKEAYEIQIQKPSAGKSEILKQISS